MAFGDFSLKTAIPERAVAGISRAGVEPSSLNLFASGAKWRGGPPLSGAFQTQAPRLAFLGGAGCTLVPRGTARGPAAVPNVLRGPRGAAPRGEGEGRRAVRWGCACGRVGTRLRGIPEGLTCTRQTGTRRWKTTKSVLKERKEKPNSKSQNTCYEYS